MSAILTITMNPAVELSTTVDHVYPNHKLRCGTLRWEAGGGGINVSRAIKRLGGTSLALTCCGGLTGEMLRARLDEEGIPTRVIPVMGWTRQNLIVSETATGQQFRFLTPGPTLREDEWQRVLGAMQSMCPPPEIVVASGSLPPGVPEDFYADMAKVVRAIGARMILDTSGPALVPAAREGVFLLKPSLRELKAFALGRVEHERDQTRVALGIIQAGRCEAAVVSLGAAGALLATESGCERLHAPSVVVRSRAGAGDSMVGGIALAVSQGRPLREAVQFGIQAGAAAVMNPGTDVCHREDVEMLAREPAIPVEHL